MNDIERKLRATLYRAFCPDSAELGEYHLGLLPADRRREMRTHLKECPHCSRELEQLRSFLEAVSADLEPGTRTGTHRDESLLRRLIARLVPPDFSAVGWAPALAGVRGDAGGILKFDTEGYHILLDIETDADRPDRRSILGLLTGDEPAVSGGAGVNTAFAALLYQAGSLVAQAEVDEFGNFAINTVPPGDYALILSSEQVEIRIEHMTLG
jgi:hypothetical protein